MRRKIIGMLVCMLLFSIAVLPVSATINGDRNFSSGKFGNTLYVGGSGEGNYTKIQDAINDSVDGDTVYVYDESSPYYENVVVDKSIFLIGKDKDTTVIDGSSNLRVIRVSADGVTVSGFTLRNASYGIYLWHSDYNTITGNTISNNEVGITCYTFTSIKFSHSNTIKGNTISNNDFGIYILGSSNNTIIGNTISSNNICGIDLEWILVQKKPTVYSRNNTILKNNFLDNKIHAFFRGDWRNTWKQNYWDRPRILPKLIFGIIYFIPLINIDWRPALKPYDI